MRAVQITEPGTTTFTETAEPVLRPGHALVRTQRLSLCGSDLRTLYNEPAAAYPLAPGATGHEMIGVVEAVADPDSPLQVGDVALTLAPDHLAMAECYLAPVEHVLVLPEGRPVEELLQAQQLGTVIYACRQLPNLVGKDVVVIGQGSAGLWFDVMARRLGARRVIALDLEPGRLALGRHYGATHTLLGSDGDPAAAVREITEGGLAEVVIEAAGEEVTLNLAIELLRDDGFLLAFGVPRSETLTLRFQDLFMKRLQLKAIVHASREPGQLSTRMALDYIATGVVDVAPMITHRFPFERVAEGYDLLNSRRDGAVKIVIEMPS